MRISDWSSDVCSSDLSLRYRGITRCGQPDPGGPAWRGAHGNSLRPCRRRDQRRGSRPHICRQGQAEFQSADRPRSEEHTSELQSLMRISYAVFSLKKQTTRHNRTTNAVYSVNKKTISIP